MSRYYPIVIWLIGFGIVLRYALMDYMVFDPTFQSDAGREFIVYSLVVETGKWQIIQNHELLSSCLFTTYFPALFQRAFNTDIVMMYKLFPCFIIPALPVVAYYLARKMVSPFYAFLASIFLMVQIFYLYIPAAARVGVALVFLGLAFLVIFNENLCLRVKTLLFIILASCVVFAHYGTTYVALFTLLLACVVLFVLWAKKQYPPPFPPALKAIAVFTMVLLAATVLWHGWGNNTVPLHYGERMVIAVVELEAYEDESGGYWALDSRERTVQVAFGESFSDMNPVLKTEFIFSWLTVMLVSWGLAIMVWRRGLKNEFLILLGACYITILVAIIAPTIGVKYGIARVYFQGLVLMSGCFVVGGQDIARRFKIPAFVFLLFVLIPYGLCTSGLLHSWMGVSRYPELLAK